MMPFSLGAAFLSRGATLLSSAQAITVPLPVVEQAHATVPLVAPSSTSGREDASWRQLAEGENKLLEMDPKLDPELLAVDPKLDPELLARNGVAEGGGAAVLGEQRASYRR
jgi:hypothetical protein